MANLLSHIVSKDGYSFAPDYNYRIIKLASNFKCQKQNRLFRKASQKMILLANRLIGECDQVRSIWSRAVATKRQNSGFARVYTELV